MIIRGFSSLALAAALTVSLPAFAQDTGAKQDIKNAGTETKNAAKDTGQGIKQGTTKAYDKTANGTKTVANKTVNGTKTGAKDVSHGTKVAADKTVDVSKDAAHSTANGTKKWLTRWTASLPHRRQTLQTKQPIYGDARSCSQAAGVSRQYLLNGQLTSNQAHQSEPPVPNSARLPGSGTSDEEMTTCTLSPVLLSFSPR